jgi:anti-sigma factor RsiW
MSEIHGAVGSYVVNALDTSERDEFEAHLAACPTCTREVLEFCETAAELSLLSTVAAPPPSVRTNILSAIKEVRPLPPEQPAPPVGADPGESTPRRALPGSQVSFPPVVVDQLALRRQRRRTRVLTALVAAVMVVAVGLGGVVYGLVQQRQSQIAQDALETQLFSASDVQVVNTASRNGGQVSFVASKSLNRAMFVATDLPEAGAGKRYQLWTIIDRPIADNQLDGGASTRQFFTGNIRDAAGLAVTIENAGPPPAQPTSDILASAEI